MDTLAEVEDIPSSQDLYRKHVGALLERLTASHGEWAVHSVQLLKFTVLLTQAGELQGPGLDPSVVLVPVTGPT
jgi:dynein assembly factor 5